MLVLYKDLHKLAIFKEFDGKDFDQGHMLAERLVEKYLFRSLKVSLFEASTAYFIFASFGYPNFYFITLFFQFFYCLYSLQSFLSVLVSAITQSIQYSIESLQLSTFFYYLSYLRSFLPFLFASTYCFLSLSMLYLTYPLYRPPIFINSYYNFIYWQFQYQYYNLIRRELIFFQHNIFFDMSITQIADIIEALYFSMINKSQYSVFIVSYYSIQVNISQQQIQIMSISQMLEPFRGASKIIFNDKYIGDKGAKEVAKFLQSHTKVECLQLKNNDITGLGFADIFRALLKNPNIRQLIFEHNKFGQDAENTLAGYFNEFMKKCTKIQRINISNNKITNAAFNMVRSAICNSESLKLLQIKYNQIPTSAISSFASQLRDTGNQALLYVQLAGNKIEKQVVNQLESILKVNRENNPIPKDNLLMTGGGLNNNFQRNQTGFQSQASFSRTNAIDDLSKENILRHLQSILNENRKGTLQMKGKLENQLAELQRRQKNDLHEMSELDRKCNQLIIINRNLNVEIDRTALEHKQMEKDLQFQERVKQQRISQANRQLNQMQSKFEEIQNKMKREHEAKLRQTGRNWETRLRNVQQRIRAVEADSNTVDNQIKKIIQKRQTLRAQYEQQENVLRQRIEEEQSQRYRFKLQSLESRIKEIKASRQKVHTRHQEILYEIENREKIGSKQLADNEQELKMLKMKEEQLVEKNKSYVMRNETIKQNINLKQISIENLEEEINKLNEEIEFKKAHNRQSIEKIITEHELQRARKSESKLTDIQKLNDYETTLRNYQLQNAKLEQQYIILEQRLQISLSKAVQEVFTENNLY